MNLKQIEWGEQIYMCHFYILDFMVAKDIETI